MVSIRRSRVLFFGFFLTFSPIHIRSLQEDIRPINIESAKQAVIDYYVSGQFDLECQSVVDEAICYFEYHDAMFKDNKTVIFDIDETALSNFEHLRTLEFCRTCHARAGQEWLVKALAPAIPAVKRFYDFLIARSYHIIFLTARRHSNHEATRNNLLAIGYSMFDRLITKENIYCALSPREFKAHKRAELVAAGFDIVGSAGDMPGDFEGGNTGYQVKIPNYLYKPRY